MRRLIVTADDFGASVSVNEAVEQACREGILTTASLMVGADAAADAVERARRLPQLKIGLHLVLVCGRPVLDPSEIPALVDADGRFSERLFDAGVNFFFNPAARRQLEAEIRAQFEAFRATGLALDHVNAHNHMHLHPTIMSLVLRAGRDYGLRAVRVPYEPVALAWSWPHRPSLERLTMSLLLAPWVYLLKQRLRRAGIHYNDYLFGLYDTGHMERHRVADILPRLPAGVSEIYFHPSTSRHGHPYPEDYASDAELAALTDSGIAAAVSAAGIRRVSFSDLH